MAKKKSRSKAKKKTKPPALTRQQRSGPGTEPQEASPLFRIPRELREQIYSELFSSTRLSHGEKAAGRIGCIRVVPAANSLALLRTCRRVRDEIGDSWLGRVLFNFEHPEALLDKLTALPHETIQRIRQVRVRGDTIMLSYPGEDYDVYYRLVSALKLLPGLRLDRLTVLGLPSAEVRYDTLNRLVLEGDGWKELCYISHDSALLGYVESPNPFVPAQDDRYLRKPQPLHWQKVLEDRDGKSSAPSVTIYRSTVPRGEASIFDPNLRKPYQQNQPKDKKEREEYGRVEDAGLMTDGERHKEIMVIVKRGYHVDYEEKRNSPFVDSDIHMDLPGKTWKEIRTICIDSLFDQDDDDDDFYSRDEADKDLGVKDSYISVDDYTWTPLHFNRDAW
ncbi:hypothetical protein QQZ08_005859 [Neonectria magnoliae]|uniref:F-box domain-containing protein n=1 Tax=Neonectria magnoliae TaxID=2732573 RepID=A0ABR1I249_9HYPO